MLIPKELLGKEIMAYFESEEGRFLTEIAGTLENTLEGRVKINNVDYRIYSAFPQTQRADYLVAGRSGVKSVSISEGSLVLLVEK